MIKVEIRYDVLDVCFVPKASANLRNSPEKNPFS